MLPSKSISEKQNVFFYLKKYFFDYTSKIGDYYSKIYDNQKVIFIFKDTQATSRNYSDQTI